VRAWSDTVPANGRECRDLQVPVARAAPDTVVIVHGGADGLTDELREHEADCRAAIERALEAAPQALNAGGGAVEAVCAAVTVSESFPLFNAGYGSALCADGSVELSASVMRGSDRAAGGVALMKRTAHPVAVALLDEHEVLLAGPSADDHAAVYGLEQLDPAEFVTERQRRRLADRLTRASRRPSAPCAWTPPGCSRPPPRPAAAAG